MLVLFFKQSNIFSPNAKSLEINTRHEICTCFKKGRQWTQNRLSETMIKKKKNLCHTNVRFLKLHGITNQIQKPRI